MAAASFHFKLIVTVAQKLDSVNCFPNLFLLTKNSSKKFFADLALFQNI